VEEEQQVPQVTLDQVRGTYKSRDSWWTVLLVDPIAARLVRLLAFRSWVNPTGLTVVAFLLGLCAAAAFAAATPGWLVAGAAAYFVSFTIDCADGKIARIRNQGTILGAWLDFFLDRVRAVLCTFALFAGQYLATGRDIFLFVAVGAVFLALFGYVNGAETDQAKRRMAGGVRRPAEDGVRRPAEDAAIPGHPAVAAQIRHALHRRRIRMNLVSGVEFEMALFVVAPLVGAAAGPSAIVVTAGVAAGLLVLFELALIARFVRTARAYDRATARHLPVPRATGDSDARPRHRAGRQPGAAAGAPNAGRGTSGAAPGRRRAT
jgi:phosphatidylglycerophosphate synthase